MPASRQLVPGSCFCPTADDVILRNVAAVMIIARFNVPSSTNSCRLHVMTSLKTGGCHLRSFVTSFRAYSTWASIG